MLALLLGVEYLVGTTFAVITVRPLIETPSVFYAATLLLTLGFVAATVVAFARVGQGGSRLVGSSDVETPPIGDRTADAHWRLGFVYANRNDPALFVEKRFGFGYTFNFGNPWSWVIVAALLLVPVVVTLLKRLAS
jgi:uncharacterized membrane protein